MIILGINDTHDASACLVIDGKIVNVVSEERIVRKKGVSSLPIHAIKYILKENKIKSNQIDHVSFANKMLYHMNLWNTHCDFNTKDLFDLQEKYYYERIFNKKNIKLRQIFPKFKPSIKLGYSLKKIPFISSDEAKSIDYEIINKIRVKTICKLLKIKPNKISFHDHHKCHAFYGYYTSPFKGKNVAVITADGGGDRSYSSVRVFKNNKIKLLSNSRKNWIGKTYDAITLFLGLNPKKHLYKIMGLAPYSNKKSYNEILKFFLNSLQVKGVDFKLNPKIKDSFFYFSQNLRHYRFDNIAGALQEFVEIRLVQWFKNIGMKTKTKNFVFSGGVANNVKANQKLAEQAFIKKLWIPPGPGDESLCLGAVYSYLNDYLGTKKALTYIKCPSNAYWGPGFSNNDITTFKNNKLVKKNFSCVSDPGYKKLAKLIQKNEIVFLCIGKQEFGQRALGHRSIICNPSKLDLVKKINSTIKMRDFWMPFTPSIIDKYLGKYIKISPKLNLNYMTTCQNSTKLGKVHLKAAMHQADSTIRPQMVTRRNSPEYYKIIEAFTKVSGIGAVLNTSLNMHDYPIVTKPIDIINEIIKNNKDINFNILIDKKLFILKKNKVLL